MTATWTDKQLDTDHHQTDAILYGHTWCIYELQQCSSERADKAWRRCDAARTLDVCTLCTLELLDSRAARRPPQARGGGSTLYGPCVYAKLARQVESHIICGVAKKGECFASVPPTTLVEDNIGIILLHAGGGGPAHRKESGVIHGISEIEKRLKRKHHIESPPTSLLATQNVNVALPSTRKWQKSRGWRRGAPKSAPWDNPYLMLHPMVPHLLEFQVWIWKNSPLSACNAYKTLTAIWSL